MKYFLLLAIVAVATATYTKPTQLTPEQAEIQHIIEAINSPYTDPATSIALQNILHDLLDIHHEPEPISVGPALVEEFEPIHVGPALVDEFEPIHVGPTFVDDDVIVAPVTPGVSQIGSSPLVQIIVNVAQAGQAGVVDGPAQKPTIPETVNVVDNALEAVNVVDQAPEAVNVIDQAPEAVNVVDLAPETVNVVQPIIPAPAVTLPESLN